MSDDQGNVRIVKTHKITIFAAIFDLYRGFATLLNDFERPTTPKVKQTEQTIQKRTHQCLRSRCNSGSSILRPIRRFASKTVFVGLVWNAFLAESPILASG